MVFKILLEYQLAARLKKFQLSEIKKLLDLAAKQLKWQHWVMEAKPD